MPVDRSSHVPDPQSPAALSVRLVRSGLKAALATLEEGHPYASLVLVATEASGAPIILISKLARHTRNLERDARASLLFDGTTEWGDPLSGPRVTVRGTMQRVAQSEAQLRRFVARHPSAQGYAGFADFGLWRLEIRDAHFIGGFGRIVEVPRSDLLIDTAGAQALMEAEADIVAHMNADHADALALYATRLAAQPAGAWRMTGIDPAGVDLVWEGRTARIDFATPVRTPQAAREALVGLAQTARATPLQSD